MVDRRADFLVTTDWLADHLDDPDVVVLDVTSKLTAQLDNSPGRALWEDEHLPGSQFLDVASAKGALSDPDADLPWMWPPPERFADTLAALGIGADARVVITARTPRAGLDAGTMWCTRAWWTMHHYGVDCAILLGGLEQWIDEGRPVVSERTPPRAAPDVAVRLDPDWDRGRALQADVLGVVERGGSCLLDALPASSFDGQRSDYGRPGHITGAINTPFVDLVERETCGFVDTDTMCRVLQEALDAPRVVTYCGGAIAATVPAFCLALLGHDDVSVYDGSLMEWAANPDLPMETSGPAGAG